MLAPWLASQSPLLRRKRTSLAARSTSETCVVSPVNASRRPSRDAAHHSGSGRMASPYPMGDFHLLFFASFPGALRVGSITSFWGDADDFRSTPMNGHLQSRSACLKRANKRLMRCSKQYDYSI